MSEIVILGSGAGFPTANRFSTSIAVCHEDDIYLFDCGEPCSALMFRAGLNPLAVRGIFVSHMHPDHVGGLAPLLFSMYLLGRAARTEQFRPWSVSPASPWFRDMIRYPASPVTFERGTYPPVSLYLPTEAVAAIATYLPAVYLAPELLPFPLDVIGIEEGNVHLDDEIEVRAHSNTHLSANPAYKDLPDLYPHMALESYSYSFDLAGQSILYSGDITALTELEPHLDNVDVVIVEVAHFDPEDLVSTLDSCSAERIVLTHIHPGLEERTSAIVDAWDSDRVTIAHDGLRIPLQ